MRAVLFSLFVFLGSITSWSQTAEWIWHAGGKPEGDEVRYFRRTFSVTGKIEKATLEATADDRMTVWVNGREAGASETWKKPLKLDVTKDLHGDENLLAIRA